VQHRHNDTQYNVIVSPQSTMLTNSEIPSACMKPKSSSTPPSITFPTYYITGRYEQVNLYSRNCDIGQLTSCAYEMGSLPSSSEFSSLKYSGSGLLFGLYNKGVVSSLVSTTRNIQLQSNTTCTT